MPELPELEVLKQRLRQIVVGKTIKETKILKPYVVKNYFSGDLSEEKIEDVLRRGKFLVIVLTCYRLYVHLMLHGAIRFHRSSMKTKKSTTVLFMLDDGAVLELNEKGHKKRMSIYIVPKIESHTRIDNLGIEPLGKCFTVGRLEELLGSDSQQLKTFLRNQRKIAGIGNAYADEILWMAGLSPFKLSTNLSKAEIEKLHRSVVDVLEWAIQHATRAERFDDRNFLRIHAKKGSFCPRCGDKIQTISFSQAETYYCPECQTNGKTLKDRRMSKFYR
jgi:formamidopyrimidine-DNA glycosylase